MRIIYCWRCRMDMPMLDEDEFAMVAKLYLGGDKSFKDVDIEHAKNRGKDVIEVLHEPMRQAYHKITGMNETNENAIMHHRISLYGPECAACGKPLRTPRASFCASCGAAKK